LPSEAGVWDTSSLTFGFCTSSMQGSCGISSVSGTQIAMCQCFPFIVLMATALSGSCIRLFLFFLLVELLLLLTLLRLQEDEELRPLLFLPKNLKILERRDSESSGMEVKLFGGGSFLRKNSASAWIFRASVSEAIASLEIFRFAARGKGLDEALVSGRGVASVFL